jgi:hypothetical protein
MSSCSEQKVSLTYDQKMSMVAGLLQEASTEMGVQIVVEIYDVDQFGDYELSTSVEFPCKNEGEEKQCP